VFCGAVAVGTVSITSCGAVPPFSRLLSHERFLLVVVATKVYVPELVTTADTTIELHFPPLIGPDDPTIEEDGAGAFWYVIPRSVHPLSAVLTS
jgi:hypothetical protein